MFWNEVDNFFQMGATGLINSGVLNNIGIRTGIRIYDLRINDLLLGLELLDLSQKRYLIEGFNLFFFDWDRD